MGEWRSKTSIGSRRVILALVAAGSLQQVSAQSVISGDGIIESTSGGFKFPDGTVQTTAAGAADPCARPDPTDEMVEVGGVCIDRYEASLWDAPVGGNQITGPIPCQENGFSCTNIYARSVAGVLPRNNITWFQAQAAMANVGKRLPTNAEWQMAVRDHGTANCNTDSGGPLPTPTHSNCRSPTTGTHDMVGNLWEWVADWGDEATGCTIWSSAYADDISCVGLGDGQTNSRLPGALVRGGTFADVGSGSTAGPFAVIVGLPSLSHSRVGFRGAR